MIKSSIMLLRYVKEGINDKQELKNKLKIKAWQLNHLIKQLTESDYISSNERKVFLETNAKSILFRDIEGKYNVIKLLQDSNELVFRSLAEPRNLQALQKNTGLSQATIYRSLSDLESIGVILKDEDDKIRLNATDQDPLYLYAQILNQEMKRDELKNETLAEIIYQDRSLILKSVPKGIYVEGDLTSFSLFSNYGIEYHTINDYYVEQDSDLKLEDVLVHSIIIANSSKDKNGIIMCIIFYIKNRDKLDLLEIKRIARKMGNTVSNIWIDIENFLRHNPIKNEILPSWEEFESKTQLYDISKDLYELPRAYPELFEELSKNIDTDLSMYIIGGENMRIRKLKPRTKDCDIVIDSSNSLKTLIKALENIGYQSKNKNVFSKNDRRVAPYKKFVYPNRSDIEIFYTDIARKFYLSPRMKTRSQEYKTFGKNKKLRLFLVSNEDIFLLKSVTDREGDLFDMTQLVQHGDNFDWSIVWDELENQEKDLQKHFYTRFLDGIEDFVQRTQIKPPFYKKLIQKAVDELICKLVAQNSPIYLDEVVSSLQGNDISEQFIRNRVTSLQRKEIIWQDKMSNGKLFLRIRKSFRIKFGKEKDLPDEKYYVNYYSISNYIENAQKKLYFPLSEKKNDSINDIVEKICTNPAFIGNRPRNLAAGIMYAANKICGFVASLNTISEVFGVSQPNIIFLSRKVIASLKNKDDS